MIKTIALLSLFYSAHSFACWHLIGSIEVNKKLVRFNQKIEHDKTYSFHKENIIAHIKVPANFERPKEVEAKKDVQMIEITLEKKNGTLLKTLSNAKIIVLGDNEAVMTKVDNETRDYTKITVQLKEI